MTDRIACHPYRSRRALRGSSVSEYAFVAALIAVACIGVVLLLGTNVKDSIGRLQGNMASRPAVSGQSAEATVEIASSGTDEAKNGVDIVPPESMMFSESMAANIEAAGANGNTELMADQLAQLAAQLLAEGKITQSQANDMIALSNQGHRMAKVEALLENGMAKAKSAEEYAAMKFDFEGKSYSAYDLMNLLAWQDQKGAAESNDLLGSAQLAGSVQADFLRQYQKVLNGGALNDPLAKAMVDNMSSQITLSGEIVFYMGYEIAIDGKPVRNKTQMNQAMAKYAAEYPGAFPGDKTIAASTHSNAAGICEVGKGDTKGKKCF